MTDKEKLIELLESFGVTPIIEEDIPGKGSQVRLQEGKGGVIGYYDFYAGFEFAADGSFTSVGVWE